MSTVEYLQGRKKYRRPQAVLFANNQGTVVTVTEIEATESIPMGDYYIPLGVEINQNSIDQNGYEFLITSDDNRGPLDFTEVRLEKRERMINGRMRSYHIADKLQISMSWDMLPSRGFATAPLFDTSGVTGLMTSGEYRGYDRAERTTNTDPTVSDKVIYTTIGDIIVQGQYTQIASKSIPVFVDSNLEPTIQEITIEKNGGYVFIPERIIEKIEGQISVVVLKDGDYAVIPERTVFATDSGDNEQIKVFPTLIKIVAGTVTIPSTVVYNSLNQPISIPEQVVSVGTETISEIPSETIMISGTSYAILIPEYTIYQGVGTTEIPSQVVNTSDTTYSIIIPAHYVYQGLSEVTIPKETIEITRVLSSIVVPEKTVFQGESHKTIGYTEDLDGVAETFLSQKYTSDGGAGGVELLDWYQNYQGSFWVYLSYDKYSNYGKSGPAYQNLNKYSQVVEVFFSDFSYSVEKRGGTNYDFWNVSLTLEEV